MTHKGLLLYISVWCFWFRIKWHPGALSYLLFFEIHTRLFSASASSRIVAGLELIPVTLPLKVVDNSLWWDLHYRYCFCINKQWKSERGINIASHLPPIALCVGCKVVEALHESCIKLWLKCSLETKPGQKRTWCVQENMSQCLTWEQGLPTLSSMMNRRFGFKCSKWCT